MPEFVRATDPVSGAEVTVTRQRAKALDLKVLDKPATSGQFGYPLPAKPRTTKAGTPANHDQKGK